MRFVVCAVYDVKAKVYSQPWFFNALAVAQRAFSDSVNDPSTHLFRNPTDYTLFHIGEYDDEVAVMTPCSHVSLGLAATFKRSV